MKRLLMRWRSWSREQRALAFFLVSFCVLFLVAGIGALVQLTPIWATDWQAPHGRYPSGPSL